MERFRVSVGNHSHLIGVLEPGVLSVTIMAATRRDPPPGLSSQDRCLTLGALDSSNSDYMTWPRQELEIGDRIGIEVLPDGEPDEPESTEKIGPILREAQENTKDPQELDREDVRRGAAVLGWHLLDGDKPLEPFFKSSSGDPAPLLQTRGMERLQVLIGDKVHVIGVPGSGIVSVHVNAVTRQTPEEGLVRECYLSLGALDSDSDTHLDWPRYDLRTGDLVVVEILPEGPFDEPVSRRSEKQISAAYYDQRRDEIRQRAQALGWTVIEEDSL